MFLPCRAYGDSGRADAVLSEGRWPWENDRGQFDGFWGSKSEHEVVSLQPTTSGVTLTMVK